ncbi:MAG: hypothetical protein ACN6PR_25415, partial [Achromobacter sp.]
MADSAKTPALRDGFRALNGSVLLQGLSRFTHPTNRSATSRDIQGRMKAGTGLTMRLSSIGSRHGHALG